MGFGKAKYDVEEKGLDPRVGHKALAADGRLDTLQQSPVTLAREEAEQKYLDMAKQVADLEPADGVFAGPFSDEDSSEEDSTEVALEVVKEEAVSEVDGFAPNAETSFYMDMDKALEEFRAESTEPETVVNDIGLTGTYSEEDIKDIEYVQKKLHADVKEAPKKEKKQAAKKPTKSAK